MTPYKALTGHKPTISHLHVFGCRAYALRTIIPRLDKLQPRAHSGYLLGYDSTNIFKIWIPSRKKIIRTRDVTFNDQQFYDPHELDLFHVLREEVEEIVHITDFPDIRTSTTQYEDSHVYADQSVQGQQQHDLQDHEEIQQIQQSYVMHDDHSAGEAPPEVLKGPEAPFSGYVRPEKTPTPEIDTSTEATTAVFTPSEDPEAEIQPDTQPVAQEAPTAVQEETLPTSPSLQSSQARFTADFDAANILPEGSSRARKPSKRRKASAG